MNGLATLKAPFAYFGGKLKAAKLVWPRFGDAPNYVEPFFGSGAVLFARPFPVRIETVNEKDPYVSNFFRAVTADPDKVAYYCDYPVIETDLHARHLWLVNQAGFRECMKNDPDYFDPKIAGWWVWGLCQWIGSGWCAVSEPAQQIPNLRPSQGINGNISQQRPNLRPHQGVQSVPQQLPHLTGDSGAAGAGIHASAFDGKTGGLYAYMNALAQRLRRTRVVCGDWTRIMGKSVTYEIGLTGVFLDPPYSAEAERQDNLYAQDCLKVAHEVRQWCLENGDNPKLRIALCGYDGEHNELETAGWDCVAWKANGGYGGQNKTKKNENAGRERIWFSSHCLQSEVAVGRVDNRDYSTLFAGI